MHDHKYLILGTFISDLLGQKLFPHAQFAHVLHISSRNFFCIKSLQNNNLKVILLDLLC